MEPKELIRAVNETDEQTLRKIKTVADFRLESTNLTRPDQQDRTFYSAIVNVLAQNCAGMATHSAADSALPLPGYDVAALKSARAAVDAIYPQTMSRNSLTVNKFYRFVATCAYRYITQQHESRYVVADLRDALANVDPQQSEEVDQVVSKARKLIASVENDQISANRSVKGMLTVLQSPQMILEDAFPGYVKSGLLGMVVRNKTAQVNAE